MPFDATTLSLHQTLELAGIRAVPDAVLEAHKAEQLRRHPGSWAGRHLNGVLFLLMGTSFFGALLMAVSGLLLHLSDAIILPTGLLSFTASSIALAPIRVRGSARWIEAVTWPASAPLAVQDVARRAWRAGSPHACLIVGELRQDSVLLDPYLLLVRGEECVCLAIWDGEEVLHIAEDVG